MFYEIDLILLHYLIVNFSLVEDITCSDLLLAINNSSNAGKFKNFSWNDIKTNSLVFTV